MKTLRWANKWRRNKFGKVSDTTNTYFLCDRNKQYIAFDEVNARRVKLSCKYDQISNVHMLMREDSKPYRALNSHVDNMWVYESAEQNGVVKPGSDYIIQDGDKLVVTNGKCSGKCKLIPAQRIEPNITRKTLDLLKKKNTK